MSIGRKSAGSGQNRRVGIAARVLFAVGAPALTAIAAQPVHAQTAPGGETQYVSDAAIPPVLLGVLKKDPSRTETTAIVDGQSRKVVTQRFNWVDIQGSHMNIDNGGLNLLPSGVPLSQTHWQSFNVANEAGWLLFTQKLKAIAERGGDWRTVTIRYIESNGGATLVTPPLVDQKGRQDIASRLAAFKTKMQGLSASTTAGAWFAEAKVPTNLAAVRQAMLDYGNSERKTPGFRRLVGAQVGADIDLSQPFTPGRTVRLMERNPKTGLDEPKIEKIHEQPDHKLDEGLNKAAQWFAEASAAGKATAHSYTDSGGRWQGVVMAGLGERCQYFKVVCGAEIAAPGWEVGGMPYGWMAGNTHYRWHFGVDRVFTLVGFGAAQDSKGNWHYVGVAGGDVTPK